MIKPIKNASVFAAKWEKLSKQPRLSGKQSDKVIKAAFKIFKEEAKHDIHDADLNFHKIFAQFADFTTSNQSTLLKEQKYFKESIVDTWFMRRQEKQWIITNLSKDVRNLLGDELSDYVPKNSNRNEYLISISILKDKIDKSDDKQLKRKAPEIFTKLAEIVHLLELNEKTLESVGLSLKSLKMQVSKLNPSGNESVTSDEIDEIKIKYYENLKHQIMQKENLNKLGLSDADIDKFPVGTPYLGRNAAEPVIGLRRRVTILMQNFRKKISPTYTEKANQGQSYNKARKFSALNRYYVKNSKARQYGGDSPEDLRFDLAATLNTSSPLPNNQMTKFELVEGDSVLNAKKLQKDHPKLGIVSCANKDRHGGSWDVARGSQEESLFRQSNLSVALEQTVNEFRGDRENHIPAAGVILTPGVTFMDPNNSDKTFACDVVSVAAVDYRKHNTGQHAEIAKAAKKAGVTPEEFMRQVTKNKYAAMFGAFLENGNTDLLISLPGLGAFQNDREMVMSILKELLTDDDAPFKNMFNSVTFNVFKMEGDETATALKGLLDK